MTRSFIVVADYRKNSVVLGTSVSFKGSNLTKTSLTIPKYTPGVPIEVSPFAYTTVLRSLHMKLDSPKATLRMARAKAGPVVTDNGNFIIDAPFDEVILRRPREVRSMHSRLSISLIHKLASHKDQAAYWGCRGWSFL
jgi:ribose 5-phosphate isomerase A